MDAYLTIRYLHFISIFIVFSTVVAEHLMLRPQMSVPELKRLARIDAVYGIGAISVVVFGLLLWLKVGKPAEFYSSNHIFLTKFALFILVGLISIRPTVFFIRSSRKKTDEMIDVPRDIVWWLRIELLILLLMPLLAVMMAAGIGN